MVDGVPTIARKADLLLRIRPVLPLNLPLIERRQSAPGRNVIVQPMFGGALWFHGSGLGKSTLAVLLAGSQGVA